ncbi:MAG: mechanosensitive ion channel [Moraxella sp.]|nr:mechanosensitive ion channel [Moraxella sp.]
MLPVFILSGHASSAANVLNKTAKSDVSTAKDSFGRDTPRGTTQGFIRAISNNDLTLASHYLDDRYLASSRLSDKEIVQRFKQALDMGGRLDADLNISGDAMGNLSDNLPSDVDKVGEIQLMNTHIDILLIRHEAKDGTVYWQFSKDTLSKLPQTTKAEPTLAQKMGFNELSKHQAFGVNIGELAALIVLVAAAYLCVYVLVWLIYWASKGLYQGLTGKTYRITPRVVMPLSLVIVAMLLPEIMLRAGVPVVLRASFGRFKDVIAWGAMAWLVLRLIDALFSRAEAMSIKRNRPEQVSILSLLRKVAKALMLVLAIIIIFGNLGFDLTTGIAALGVGGLALAFGAQKTIENLIGSVVVVADRPVHVGDYCRFGTMEGTVIDIGIRSSRIRTLNRTIVTVPNGEFSSMQIENYTARDMFHFLHYLYLKRDAKSGEIAQLVMDLQQFLKVHELTNDEWTQVRISELRQDCFVIEMRCYLPAPDVRVFYANQSALLIDVLAFVENYAVEHALPSQEIHINTQDAIDMSKTDKNAL